MSPSSSLPDVPPARDRLARLVALYGALPDDAAALAADVLEVVARRYDPAGTAAAIVLLGASPPGADLPDDASLTPDDLAALDEGSADLAAGRVFTFDEVLRDLGVTGAQVADERVALDVGRDRGDAPA